MSLSDSYLRRLSAEVDVYADKHDRIHQHDAMFHWRNETFLSPRFVATFGAKSAAEIYARAISLALERTEGNNVVSLGCGTGAQELEILRAADRLGLPRFRIKGMELSPIMATEGRRIAGEAGFGDRLTFIEGDLNDGIPITEPLSAVIAHHCLHHIEALERLFDQIAERLLPEGVFASFDMIGRNGHMLWPETRPVVRALWSMLPDEKRFDHAFRRPMPYYQDWDCSISSFEGVRAQDILRLIAERFAPEALVVWGAISQCFLGARACANFDVGSQQDRDFIAAVHELECRLLDQRKTTPVEMCGIFSSRRSTFAKRPEVLDLLRRSVRKPDEEFQSIESVDFPDPYRLNSEKRLPVLACGMETIVAPETQAALALQEGWEAPEPDGVYAILDEQALAFQVDRPSSHVRLHVWNFFPTDRGLRIRASALEGRAVEVGPLAYGENAVLEVESATASPTCTWKIRLSPSEYRKHYLEGGDDARPLSYRLARIEPVGVE